MLPQHLSCTYSALPMSAIDRYYWYSLLLLHPTLGCVALLALAIGHRLTCNRGCRSPVRLALLCGMSAEVRIAEYTQGERAEPELDADSASASEENGVTATSKPTEHPNGQDTAVGTIGPPPLTVKEAQAFFPPGTTPQPPPLSLPPTALSFLASHPLRYPVLSLMRQWANLQRERFCPPSSYSTASRSSLTIVDGSPLVGGSALTFIRGTKDRPAAFTRVVCCQESEEWAAAIEANAASYGADGKVTVVRQHPFAYFQSRYEADSKYACMYIDPAVPSDSLQMQLTASNDDYTLSSPFTFDVNKPFTLLSHCIQHMLQHSRHAVPLLILSLPAAFSTSLYRSLARYSAEEVNIAKPHAIQFLILALNPNTTTAATSSSTAATATSVAVARPHPYADPSIPLSSSHRQLSYLFHSTLLQQRLKQLLSTQLYRCPIAQGRLWACLEAAMRGAAGGGDVDDEAVYTRLRQCYHDELLPTDECKDIRKRKEAAKCAGCGGEAEDGRANSRVTELVDLIRQHTFPSPLPRSPASLLDVGCSEGSITGALAAALSVPASAAHGCDVREVARSAAFTFSLITSTTLPYPSNSFHLVLALMSLHHIDTVTTSLAEIARVLVPGGVLLVREHDLSFPQLAPLLDVMHGLYTRVWSDPAEQPAFCDDYYAHYRPRAVWTQMVEAAGLVRCRESPDGRRQMWDGPGGERRGGRDGYVKNPFQYYYALYEKPVAGQTVAREEGDAMSHSEKKRRADVNAERADERGDVKRRAG